MANPELKVAASTEITIEKNIPVPAAVSKNKYPWLQMEVGDSFICPSRFAYENARVASQRHAPKLFKAKVIDGDGFRIWRVK